MKIRTIAFDFDGVIAQYKGFKSVEHMGEPNPNVVKAIRTLKEKGHKIIIHSTRSNEQLRDYCERNDIPFDYINENPKFNTGNKGKPVASVYVDDRAVIYSGQDSESLVNEIEKFKAYWERD